MTIVQLLAQDQNLSFNTQPKLAAGDKNSVMLQVEFSPEWDGYGKTAVFYTGKNATVYEMILIEGKCVIPHEVLENPDALYIGIRGTNADSSAIKTSAIIKCKIDVGAPVPDGVHVEPTPSVYQQILTAYGALNDSVTEEAKRRAAGDEAEAAARQEEIALERARIDELVANKGEEFAVVVTIDEPELLGTLKRVGNMMLLECQYIGEMPAGISRTEWFFPEEYAPISPLSFLPINCDSYEGFRGAIKKDSSGKWALFVSNRGEHDFEGSHAYPVEFSVVYPLGEIFLEELADARVGHDGTKYSTTGNAIRQQFDGIRQAFSGPEGYSASVAVEIFVNSIVNEVDNNRWKLFELETEMSSLPLKTLQGTASSPIILRELTTGIYIISGQVRMNRNSELLNNINNFYFVENNGGSITYASKLVPSLHALHRYEITDTNYIWKATYLGEMLTNISTLQSQMSTVRSKTNLLTNLSTSPNVLNKAPTSRGNYLGEIRIVDTSRASSGASSVISADAVEAWMYLGRDTSKNPQYIWKRIAFDAVNYTNE